MKRVQQATSSPRLALAASILVLAAGCGDTAPATTDTGGADTVVPIDAADTGTPVDFDAVITYDTLQPDTGGGATDTVVADTHVASCDDDPMPFYCPCDNNVQCASGYCVAVDEAGVASRCSRTCEDTCPNGWNCRGVSTGGDPVFICLPPVDNLCDPCTTDATCGTLGDRCVTFEDGSYCGRDCQSDPGVCPDEYVCGEVTDESGQILAYQCVPESGSCNCPVGTDYDTDPDNCGGCGKACDYTGGVPGCDEGECFLDDCATGFVNLNTIDADGCEYECTVVPGEDWPDAVCDGSSCDQDCDGLDGTWTRGIFVDPAGGSGATGAPDDPIQTIAGGIAKAEASGRDHVYVAAGTYNEQVIVKEGVSLFGGYSNDGKWTRDLAQYQTVVTSSSGFTSVRAMVVEGIRDTKTVIDGVIAVGGTNANPSGSSYGIWVRDCSNKLELVRVTAIGGNGGAGQAGTGGSPGANGNDGDPGTNASEWDETCFSGCDDYRGRGGAGGSNACSSGRNAAGGTGGTPPSCTTGSSSGSTSPGGTPGGPGENAGQPGDDGDNGGHGSGGNPAGSVSGAGFWLGESGADGGDGENATGGGGGGSGKSVKSTCRRDYGGGGGGGGGGGCAGTKGTAGKAGGGSFGLFLVDASPRLTNCKLGHKSGGNGGNGGLGGPGGNGKAGRAGGNGTGDATKGGKGGNGGNGGDGGHGGGGAGGVAFGLYLAGNSDPSCQSLGYSPPGAGGSGGIGGVGGNSGGNKGANGLTGDKNKSTSSCP